jgi:hypothetical protein
MIRATLTKPIETLNGDDAECDIEVSQLEEIALVPAVVEDIQILFASIALAAPDERHQVFCRVARDLAVLGRRGFADWPTAADCLTCAAQAHGLIPIPRCDHPALREHAIDGIQTVLAQAWRDAKAAVEFRPNRHAVIGKVRIVGKWDNVSKTYDGDGVESASEMQRAQDEMIRRQRSDHGPANSTIAALEYLIVQNDPAMLRAWLAGRSREEVRALKSLLVPK